MVITKYNKYSSKNLLIAIFCVLNFALICQILFGDELEQSNYFHGSYCTIASNNIKIYFPSELSDSIDILHSEFSKIRKNLLKYFPEQEEFEIPVIITNKNDKVENVLEISQDTIILPLFNDFCYFSMRSYTIYERFSLQLAYLYLLRSISSSYYALKRKLALLSLPTWFLDGLAFFLAFETNTVQKSRLLDMARYNKLYKLHELDAYKYKRYKIKEDMLYQMHDMFSFWHKQANNHYAGIKLIQNLSTNWKLFDNLFKKHFKLSIKNALNLYLKYINEECQRKPDCYNVIKIDKDIRLQNLDFPVAEYLQNPIIINYKNNNGDSKTIKIWLSNKRYNLETYDIYISKQTYDNSQKSISNHILLKNVHPKILYSPKYQSLFVAKYCTTKNLQKKLFLYKITFDESFNWKVNKLVNTPGSYYPIKIEQDILYFLINTGSTHLLAKVNIDGKVINQGTKQTSYQIIYNFKRFTPLLDIDIDLQDGKIFLITQKNLEYILCMLQSYSKNFHNNEDKSIVKYRVLYRSNNKIYNLRFHNNNLFFLMEKDFKTFQLHQLLISEKGVQINTLTSLPGGVWSYNILDDFTIIASTLDKGLMRVCKVTIFPIIGYCINFAPEQFYHEKNTNLLNSIQQYKYEIDEQYLLPHASKDYYEGYSIGFYSYIYDTLNKFSMDLLQAYGLKSHKYRYYVNYNKNYSYKQNLNIEIQDRIVEQSYLSNDYFERIRLLDIIFSYLPSLSTKMKFGATFVKRKIAEYDENANELPTTGYDNSLFIKLERKAIKSDAFSNIMPKDGSNLEIELRKTLNLLKSDINYDFLSFMMNVYEPIDAKNHLEFRLWLAEDIKKVNSRRPSDLSLGGDDYLKAFSDSYVTGNSLRYFSASIVRPFDVFIPLLEEYVLPELIYLKVFGEIGDVKNSTRKFSYLYDYGIEINFRGLLFRRIPLNISFGVAYALKNDIRNSYMRYSFQPLFVEF